MPGISRRSFLAGSAAAGLGLAWPAFSDERPMPTRLLGATGARVSLAGLGCYPLGHRKVADDDAVRVVERALELGITYFDTAPSYGASEDRVGKGLAGGRRDKVFLATKTLARDRAGATAELERSLKRLQTDRVDLWQFHALKEAGDTDRLLSEDGAVRAAEDAVKQGKVRFVGVTGHYDPQVFVDAVKRHAFATVLIPLNCIDPWHRSFEEHALPFLVEKGTGVVAMKVYCSGALAKRDIVKPEDCLRYTYGLPISTCIVGCATVAEVELAAHVARNLEAMDDAERKAARAKTKPFSPDLEWYKR